VYNITKEKLPRLHTMQHHLTSQLIIAMQNTERESSYCPLISATTVGEDALLGGGDGKQRENCLVIDSTIQ